MWFMCSLRPAGSTPCLLPTPPRGDAVGTVCGAEPSNCTDGTFTRVDARFTGARNYGKVRRRCWWDAGGHGGPRPFDQAQGLRRGFLRRSSLSELLRRGFLRRSFLRRSSGPAAGSSARGAAPLRLNFGRVGRKQRSEAWIANALASAPHQTGRAVFPHPAFRVPCAQAEADAPAGNW